MGAPETASPRSTCHNKIILLTTKKWRHPSSLIICGSWPRNSQQEAIGVCVCVSVLGGCGGAQHDSQLEGVLSPHVKRLLAPPTALRQQTGQGCRTGKRRQTAQRDTARTGSGTYESQISTGPPSARMFLSLKCFSEEMRSEEKRGNPGVSMQKSFNRNLGNLQ
ncbi:hypothetical protein PAMP_002107 [Pampus punctatissimus]